MTKIPVAALAFAYSYVDAVAAQKADIELVACMTCGHVYNRLFKPYPLGIAGDPEDVPALDPSRVPVLADHVVKHHRLRGKIVAAFGKAAAEILERIAEEGGNRGVLYDPADETAPPTAIGGGTLDGGPDVIAGHADAVLIPYGLEQSATPLDILRRAHRILKPGGFLLVEVPDGSAIFADMNLWDLNYTQFSYFSPSSLRYALLEAGFREADIRPASGNDCLDGEGIRGEHNGRQPRTAEAILAHDVAGLPLRLSRATTQWKQRAARWRYLTRRVVLWGAGTKAVSLLATLRIRPGRGIDYVVDVDSRVIGRFIPGTGQQIVEPGFLKRYQPDIVLVMNKASLEHVRTKLRELDVNANIMAVSMLEEFDALAQ